MIFGFGLLAAGFGLRALGCGLRVLGFGFWAWSFGNRPSTISSAIFQNHRAHVKRNNLTQHTKSQKLKANRQKPKAKSQQLIYIPGLAIVK